jgi:uncharacterized protein (DUF433 family)
MSTPSTNRWKYLASDPKPSYRQLFVKGRRIRATTLYDATGYHDQPMTPEEVADAYVLPLEAVHEAIAYCESNPPQIEEDYRREAALMEATGMSDAGYQHHGKPKLLSPHEKARIRAL